MTGTLAGSVLEPLLLRLLAFGSYRRQEQTGMIALGLTGENNRQFNEGRSDFIFIAQRNSQTLKHDAQSLLEKDRVRYTFEQSCELQIVQPDEGRMEVLWIHKPHHSLLQNVSRRARLLGYQQKWESKSNMRYTGSGHKVIQMLKWLHISVYLTNNKGKVQQHVYTRNQSIIHMLHNRHVKVVLQKRDIADILKLRRCS